MKSNNIFADHVAVRGPPPASLTKISTIMLAQATRTGHIIRQRVDPDVHDLRCRVVGVLSLVDGVAAALASTASPVETPSRRRSIVTPSLR